MAPPCHRARSSEPAADLLTSLPPLLLDAILARLDLRDAVRTSALSRAWRRRWEALPYISLSFLDKRGTPPVAVDRLLVRYPGHISRFSFYLDEHSLTRVADWLIAPLQPRRQVYQPPMLCLPPLLQPSLLCLLMHPTRVPGAAPMLHTTSPTTIDLGNYVSSGDFEGFIARFAPVRKLILHTSYPLPPLTNGHLMETLPCTFNNLKSLILWTHFCERPAILSTFCLLMNAPNLEELEITIDRGDSDEIEANAVYQDTQLTDAFCANLQVVKIDDIGWLPNEMCFIELVLSKAKVLLTTHLRLGCLSSKSNEDALCELMTYRRASPHAQVFFNGEIE
ncbi:hypothetical protein ACQ4PT_014182 [Festuca glaucescens]